MKETARGMKISTRYAEVALLPDEVLQGIYSPDAIWETWDGVSVRFQFLGSFYRDSEDILDDICLSLYGMSFIDVRENWSARLGQLKNVWHKVRMVKV
jgi:hypothetical protein